MTWGKSGEVVLHPFVEIRLFILDLSVGRFYLKRKETKKNRLTVKGCSVVAEQNVKTRVVDGGPN